MKYFSIYTNFYPYFKKSDLPNPTIKSNGKITACLCLNLSYICERLGKESLYNTKYIDPIYLVHKDKIKLELTKSFFDKQFDNETNDIRKAIDLPKKMKADLSLNSLVKK